MTYKKKVAFILPILTDYRLHFFEKLYRTLSESGIELMVFHGLKDMNDGRPSYKGNPNFPNKTYTYSETTILGFKLVRSDAYRKAISFKPDLVICQGAVGVLHNWMLGFFFRNSTRKLFYWTCGWENTRSPIKAQLKTLLTRVLFNRSDCHICYSEKALGYIRKLGFTRKAVVAYNGIDIHQYKTNKDIIFKSRDIIRNKYNASPTDYIYLYVGGISKNKQVELLINAFLKVRSPRIKLWIIGDGPELAKLQKENLDIPDITFMGRITEDVDYYFHASDCLVLPGEGGLALNHALLWNTICIVSEADGTELDLIEEGKNGLFFERQDLHSLADTMEKAQKIKVSDTSSIVLERSNTNEMVNIFANAIISELQK